MSAWCWFGLHRYRVLDVSPWGRVSWHTWTVRRECEDCGHYSEYKETNERRLPAEQGQKP